MADKPPMGIMPENIRRCERINRIKEAIERYLNVNLTVNPDWIDEYNRLIVVEKDYQDKF